MKPLTFILTTLVLLAGGQNAPAQKVSDTLIMNDAGGTTRVGHVRGVDARQIRLEVAIPGAGPEAKMSVTIPRADVARIEFAEDAKREQLLADPDREDIHEIGVVWHAWEHVLDLPKSPSSRIGNIYATLLLQTNDAARAKEALAIFQLIEEKTWDGAEKEAARQGRLRAMVATGDAAAAVAEAEQLAIASEDPAVLIEAKFILAEAARNRLETLQMENPRWMEDVLVRPERERLLHESLDLYLHPYLFFGSDIRSASRGLWGAIAVHRLNDDTPSAIEASRDLVRLYPDTTFASQASEYMASLPKELLEQDNEKEAREESNETK